MGWSHKITDKNFYLFLSDTQQINQKSFQLSFSDIFSEDVKLKNL